MEVENTVSDRIKHGRIASGPTNMEIWWAWKRTNISCSSDDREGDGGRKSCISCTERGLWTDLIEVGLNPDAYFRTRTSPFCFLATMVSQAAFSRHSFRLFSENIQDLHCVDCSKDIMVNTLSCLRPYTKYYAESTHWHEFLAKSVCFPEILRWIHMQSSL